MAKDEPQSYGSQSDWVKGTTGQDVNRQKGNPNSQHGDFYAPDQGGRVSDVQAAENAQPAARVGAGNDSVTGLTDQKSGAKRGGFFKNRDYK